MILTGYEVVSYQKITQDESLKVYFDNFSVQDRPLDNMMSIIKTSTKKKQTNDLRFGYEILRKLIFMISARYSVKIIFL